jgi:hypothetical protein
MATLRQLAEDGLETLGTIELGTTIAMGDPTSLPGTVGTGDWYGVGVRPGTWHVFGRPYDRDPDLLGEIVLVHADGVRAFYDLYDEAAEAAAFLLPTGRLGVLDGLLRTDLEVLKSLVEPDELPWVLDRGLVARGIAQHPAYVYHPRGDVLLVAIGLDRAPQDRATTQPFSSADTERENEPD